MAVCVYDPKPYAGDDDVPANATFLHGCSGSLLGVGQQVHRCNDTGILVLQLSNTLDGTFMMCRTQLGVVVDVTVEGMVHNMRDNGAADDECCAVANVLRGLLQNPRCERPAGHQCTADCAQF